MGAVTAKKSVRSYLSSLTIGGKSTIAFNSGVYYLTMKYEQEASALPVEAAIVIGEIAFDNTGSVLAPGAKWSKLLSGEKQKEGKAVWRFENVLAFTTLPTYPKDIR